MRGSCHCGTVAYEARVTFDDQTLRCNCSICTKARGWILPMPASHFKVLKGEDALSVYTFGGESIEHNFCSRCGIKVFGRSNEKSPMHPFIAINVATLEIEPEEFMKFSITYLDGRHDRFEEAPAITGYL